jgi:nitroreductase
MKDKLAHCAFGQQFLAKAPVVFVVCAVPENSSSRYGFRGETLYAIQDTASMVSNLIIAAESLGYGACWVGAFDEMRVSQTLSLKSHTRPVAIVPVGPGEKASSPPGRFPLEKICTFID